MNCNTCSHAHAPLPAARWVPVLLIPGPDDLHEGMSQSFCERQPGEYATAGEAMHVAIDLMHARPDAIGASARHQGWCSMTAPACTTCAHAHAPLPDGWAALDFFDRRAMAGQLSHRLDCKACSDSDKPCLKPAPAPAQQAPAATEDVANLPTVGQAQRLICGTVLGMMQAACREANEACEGVGWGAEYEKPANAAELALEAVQRLGASLPCDADSFELAWWRAASVVQLAADAFPDKNTPAWRLLNSAAQKLNVLHAVLECAAG